MMHYEHFTVPAQDGAPLYLFSRPMPSGHAFTSNQSGVERLFFRARLPAMGKAAAVGAAAR